MRRKFFYNTLCFTTNASMLYSVFLKKLSAFKPIEINVSLHSLEPALWARIFGQDTRRAEIPISSLPLILAHRMALIGTIVPLPKICGWDDIIRTYSHFVAQGASSMILYWPGDTKLTPVEVARDLECPLVEFTDFAERMKTAYRVPLIPHPDMVSPLPIPVETIVIARLKKDKPFAIEVIGKYLRTADKEVLDETYAVSIAKYLKRVPLPTPEAFRSVIEELAQGNPKAKGQDPRKFYDDGVFQDLEKSGFINSLNR